MKLIANLRLHFEAQNVHFEVKNVHFEVKHVHIKVTNIRLKSTDLQKMPSFVFCSFTKFKTQPALKLMNYQKYCVVIEFLFWQKNHYDLNFNWIYDFNYGMQGLSFKYDDVLEGEICVRGTSKTLINFWMRLLRFTSTTRKNIILLLEKFVDNY